MLCIKLKVLIFLSLSFLMINSYAQSDVNPSAEEIMQQREAAIRAMESVDRYMKRPDVFRIIDKGRVAVDSLVTEKKSMESLLRDIRDPTIFEPKNTGHTENIEDFRITSEKVVQDDGNALAPIIAVSFSMPETVIKSLLTEATKINASVVIQGFMDGEMFETIKRIREIAGDGSFGLRIDPTIFRRFNITKVPTFVLPIESVKRCTGEGCPLPAHVKASGAASLQYFLDLISRTGEDNEQRIASEWLEKYNNV